MRSCRGFCQWRLAKDSYRIITIMPAAPPSPTPLLDGINLPCDLRRLSPEQLPQLAGEVRAEILRVVSEVGGHLSSNLGAVELAVALHYIFDTPRDLLVWDVGHQTYAHKILTGRRALLPGIRQRGGIAGFPVREESEYDAFGTAHASTSISAALGMAAAIRADNDNDDGDENNKGKDKKADDERRRVVAIIGDGAMSGGMAFEALNNAGAMADVDMLVILNDNEMSISPAVGALNNYLGRVLASRFYNRIQSGGRKMLAGMPAVQRFARRAHEHLKGMVLPGTLFEEFGFNYIGPIDGHDLSALVPTLRALRMTRGAQFLHIVTVKGKGFQKAEADPVLYHGVSPFVPKDGIAPLKVEKEEKQEKQKPKAPSYSQVFGDWLCAAAARDKRIVAITPAMREGSGLAGFARRYPRRYFDVGIAEQHALTFAAGLACAGKKPVVAIYSTFLQRGYDQLIHDIALQKLPVVFAIDRAGIVGADGATHHGAFDLSYLRCIPNIVIMTPSDESEMWKMLDTAISMECPVAVRYPRGAGLGAAMPSANDAPETITIGRGVMIREGKDAALLAFGTMRQMAQQVAENINAAAADMRFVKPLDEELILQVADKYPLIAVVEENTMAGGAGSAVAELLHRHNKPNRVLQFGLPDAFAGHGKSEDLLADCNLTTKAITTAIQKTLAKGR